MLQAPANIISHSIKQCATEMSEVYFGLVCCYLGEALF